jgi:hypothetical protein
MTEKTTRSGAMGDWEIDPRTERWPLRRRLGFGGLALLPTALLGAALVLGGVHLAAPRASWVTDAAAILLYTHIAAQVLVVMIFGHILLNHTGDLSAHAKAWWLFWFVLAAPAAVPLFWFFHVLVEEPSALRAKRVRVLATCYAREPHPSRLTRDDGVEVEHCPAPAARPGPWGTSRPDGLPVLPAGG